MKHLFQWLLLAGPMVLLAHSPIQAQISGDGTLPTQVDRSGEVLEINGGARAGNNLFHSFKEFSVPTNSTAFFNNASDIANIIGRVTGGSSNIDGLIQANGGANLILINPNGISFGPNARLDLGGSFLASTGSILNFADGSQFSALDGQTPMLTVSVPLGVQFGTTTGSVQLQGSNLGVGTGQTLALVGGDVSISGGSLTAPGGRIELGSVADGSVSLTPDPQGWTLDYEGVAFGNLQLGQQSILDASGLGGGNIQVQGGQIFLQEGAQIRSFTLGDRPGGTVEIRASESVELVGTGAAEFQQSFIAAAINGTLSPSVPGTVVAVGTVSTGSASDIVIDTPALNLREGAAIFSPAFATGTGGDVSIEAESVELNGSGILVGSSGTGMAGGINIDTEQLGVRDKSVVISATLGDGTGGNVEVNATDSVEVTSFPTTELTPELLLVTGIYTNTTGGTGTGGELRVETGDLTLRNGVLASNTGALLPNEIIPNGGAGGDLIVEASGTVDLSGFIANQFTSGLGTSTFSPSPAGDLTISAENLVVREGADVSTSTLGAGKGGNLSVNATGAVELFGSVANGVTFGGLLATSGRANFPNLEVSGDSGDLSVSAGELIVRDGAAVDVQSFGIGNAGTLEIDADLVLLDNQAAITASTRSGQGGNIVINAQNALWRRGSETTATASGTGDGGNIFIEVDTLVALEDSDITANAVEGMGGNIQIAAAGIFLCSTCQAIATSELGVDGEVELVDPETETSIEFLEVPEEAIASEQTVALACRANGGSNSRFTITGRGGLPPRPSDPLSPQALVSFDTAEADNPSESVTSSTSKLPPPAQGWYVNDGGTIVLAAQAPGTPRSSELTPPDCHTP